MDKPHLTPTVTDLREATAALNVKTVGAVSNIPTHSQKHQEARDAERASKAAARRADNPAN